MLVYGAKKKNKKNNIPLSRLYHATSQFCKKVMISAGNGIVKLKFILFILINEKLTLNATLIY